MGFFGGHEVVVGRTIIGMLCCRSSRIAHFAK